VRLPPPGASGILPQSERVPISYSEFAWPAAITRSRSSRRRADFHSVGVLGVTAARICSFATVDGTGQCIFRRICAAIVLPWRGDARLVEQADRLICVEKTFLSDDGEACSMTSTPFRLQPIEKLLQEYEADLERGREMCAILADYALLEPFTLQACSGKAAP